MVGIYLIIYWRLFITVYYYKWCHNEESFTYIIMYMCVSIKLILKRGIAGSMFCEFKNFDVSTKRLSEEALPVYSPITDEWESSIPHIVQVHYCQLGPQKITHACLGLHFPITGKVHRLSMVWACVFLIPYSICSSSLTISLLRCLSFICFAYFLNSCLPPSKYIDTFFPVCTCILILHFMS